MRTVAFATCREYADLDIDDRLAIAPLAALGIAVVPAVWDDPAVEWTRFDAVVLRSTWDYPPRVDAFLAWAARVPRLINALDLVRWNTHKRYLLELEAAGIPIVPTRLAEPGGAWDAFHDWHEIVVKPAVSAGSVDTARYLADDPRATAHIRRLHDSGRTVMVQPYHHEVDVAGETALMYIGGQFSHAVRKGALLTTHASMTDALFAPEEIERRDPTAQERELGEAVLAFVRRRFATPVYARIDLLPGPVLIELELTEPSLFLGYGDGATQCLATAISAAVPDAR